MLWLANTFFCWRGKHHLHLKEKHWDEDNWVTALLTTSPSFTTKNTEKKKLHVFLLNSIWIRVDDAYIVGVHPRLYDTYIVDSIWIRAEDAYIVGEIYTL